MSSENIANLGIADLDNCLLIGNPNSGKTLLFNKLTGLKKKVANFPGVTIDLSRAESLNIENFFLVDFPGIYSLNPLSEDERIAVDHLQVALKNPNTKGVVCVLDGTRLERSFFLALQLRKLALDAGKGLIWVVNMLDEVSNRGMKIDSEGLEARAGVKSCALSAKTLSGVKELETLLRSLQSDPKSFIPKQGGEIGNEIAGRIESRALAKDFGPKAEVFIKSQSHLDRILLSSFWGPLVFVALMLFLFQAIFSWSSPAMDGIEALLGWMGEGVASLLPEGLAADFARDAVFGGVGGFLVFVPQIFVLSFIIGLLEDSGYLARASVLCHRFLSFFGLSGKSFVPLLTGHACAIPAIMATRSIESKEKRLLTMIAIPLMACSARLPVYGLFIAALIPPVTFLGGLFGLQGIAFFALYAFGLITALLVSAAVHHFVLKGRSEAPFVLELPPYRLPNFRTILISAWERSWAFVKGAGPTIFWVCMVVWILGYFPNGPEHLETSFLARMGKVLEPLLAPLDLDWKYGVAIVSSFIAREVFVGTLGTLVGIEAADENITALSDKLMSGGLSLKTGLALLAFYAIALQCSSTLAILKKEVGSWKLPIALFVGFSILAYLAALATYHITALFV